MIHISSIIYRQGTVPYDPIRKNNINQKEWAMQLELQYIKLQ